METISYKVEFPDPYENAYERVTMEFERRLRCRETEGIEAALKEHGYVNERTCTLGTNVMGVSRCSLCASFVGEKDNYCPHCGAKVVE